MCRDIVEGVRLTALDGVGDSPLLGNSSTGTRG
jgi:hypothetical protein